LSYDPDKQTDSNILPTPTDSVGVGDVRNLSTAEYNLDSVPESISCDTNNRSTNQIIQKIRNAAEKVKPLCRKFHFLPQKTVGAKYYSTVTVQVIYVVHVTFIQVEFEGSSLAFIATVSLRCGE